MRATLRRRLSHVATRKPRSRRRKLRFRVPGDRSLWPVGDEVTHRRFRIYQTKDPESKGLAVIVKGTRSCTLATLRITRLRRVLPSRIAIKCEQVSCILCYSLSVRDHPGYTHGHPEVDPYLYPGKTRTRMYGYGFLDGYRSHGCGLRPVAGLPGNILVLCIISNLM